jgi:hypothetical protein
MSWKPLTIHQRSTHPKMGDWFLKATNMGTKHKSHSIFFGLPSNNSKHIYFVAAFL